MRGEKCCGPVSTCKRLSAAQVQTAVCHSTPSTTCERLHQLTALVLGHDYNGKLAVTPARRAAAWMSHGNIHTFPRLAIVAASSRANSLIPGGAGGGDDASGLWATERTANTPD